MPPAPPNTHRSEKSHIAGNVFAVCAVLLVAAICVMNFLSGAKVLPNALNSDMLLMPSVLEDLLRQGGMQSDWYLSPSPYWFPDYLMFLVGFGLVNGAYLQLAIFTATQILVFSATVYGLMRALDVRSAALATGLTVSLFAWLALPAVEPFSILLVPETHFGAFMASLLVLTLVLRVRRFAVTAGAALIIAAIVVLTVFSDDMFTGHTALVMLMLFLMLGASSFSEQRRDAFKMAGLFLISGLLGTAAYLLIIVNPVRYGYELSLSEAPSRITELATMFARSAATHPLPTLIAPVMTCVGLWVLAKLLWSRSGWPFDGFIMALAFMGLSGAITVALALGNANVPLADRYFLTVLAVPLVLAVAGAARLSSRQLDPILGVATAGFVAISGWQVGLQIQLNGLHIDYYPNQIACIDRALVAHDAKLGVAHYWESRPITTFNRSGAVVAPVQRDLKANRWHVSKRSFHDAYDFAVVRTDSPPYETLSGADIRKTSGAAIAKSDCGNVRVLVYAKGGIRVPPQP